jgi:hydrogenase maturation protease
MGRILVVGVGNTVMRDDGLGVYTLERVKEQELPANVDTVEAGTALMDALPDLKPYDKVIFIDAVQSDSEGVHTMRLLDFKGQLDSSFNAHEMGIEETLRMRLLEDKVLPEIVIMGIKPEKIEFGTELSDNVASKIPELAEAVLDEIINTAQNSVL